MRKIKNNIVILQTKQDIIGYNNASNHLSGRNGPQTGRIHKRQHQVYGTRERRQAD